MRTRKINLRRALFFGHQSQISTDPELPAVVEYPGEETFVERHARVLGILVFAIAANSREFIHVNFGMLFHVIFHDLHNGVHNLVDLATVGGHIFFTFKFIVDHPKDNVGVENIILKSSEAHFVTESAQGIKIVDSCTWNSGVLNGENIFVAVQWYYFFLNEAAGTSSLFPEL